MITLLTILLSVAFIICGKELGVKTLTIALILGLSGVVSIIMVSVIGSIQKGEGKLNWKDIKFDTLTFLEVLLILAALVAGKTIM